MTAKQKTKPKSLRAAFIRVHADMNVEKRPGENNIEKPTLDNGIDVNAGLDFDSPLYVSKPKPAEIEKELIHVSFDDIKTILNEWNTTKRIKYYAVLHDKDFDDNNELVKPHYHIVIDFTSPTPWEQVKAKFPYGDIEQAGKVRFCVRYLIHADQPIKTPYEWTEVYTNADLEPYKLASNTMQEINLLKIYEMIDNEEITEYNKSLKIPTPIYAKHRSRIENALSLHVHKVTLNPKRDLDVFFFTGPARTGKSHFATWLAKQTNPEQ
ncbi:MAG: hypothetical protein E4H06_02245, partial [Methanosarcina sp.]